MIKFPIQQKNEDKLRDIQSVSTQDYHFFFLVGILPKNRLSDHDSYDYSC